MNELQSEIAAWLQLGQRAESYIEISEYGFALGTDVGIRRSENQDRVLAVAIPAKAYGSGVVFALVLADGMGGMRQGGDSATTTVAALASEIATSDQPLSVESITRFVIAANREVYQVAGGGGGSTLSAVLFAPNMDIFTVNVGDSRIYSASSRGAVERLTTDDSLAEAVGGTGRELLQFVGMGDGINPHVRKLQFSDGRLLITSDGIHEMSESVLYRVVCNSAGLEMTAKRLAAIARWIGGVDNASCIVLDIEKIHLCIGEAIGSAIKAWSPFGSLLIRTPTQEARANAEQLREADAAGSTTEGSADQQARAAENLDEVRSNDRRSRQKKNKRPRADSDRGQLDLTIELKNDKDEPDGNADS